jgi:hypothetical protein
LARCALARGPSFLVADDAALVTCKLSEKFRQIVVLARIFIVQRTKRPARIPQSRAWSRLDAL